MSSQQLLIYGEGLQAQIADHPQLIYYVAKYAHLICAWEVIPSSVWDLRKKTCAFFVKVWGMRGVRMPSVCLYLTYAGFQVIPFNLYTIFIRVKGEKVVPGTNSCGRKNNDIHHPNSSKATSIKRSFFTPKAVRGCLLHSHCPGPPILVHVQPLIGERNMTPCTAAYVETRPYRLSSTWTAGITCAWVGPVIYAWHHTVPPHKCLKPNYCAIVLWLKCYKNNVTTKHKIPEK